MFKLTGCFEQSQRSQDGAPGQLLVGRIDQAYFVWLDSVLIIQKLLIEIFKLDNQGPTW